MYVDMTGAGAVTVLSTEGRSDQRHGGSRRLTVRKANDFNWASIPGKLPASESAWETLTDQDFPMSLSVVESNLVRNSLMQAELLHDFAAAVVMAVPLAVAVAVG